MLFSLSCLHFNALFSSILVESRFIRQKWNAITTINLFTSVDTRLQLLGCMTVTDSYLISEFSFIQVLLFVVTYNKQSVSSYLYLFFINSINLKPKVEKHSDINKFDVFAQSIIWLLRVIKFSVIFHNAIFQAND